jgi:predicted RNA-binding protein YlqC (UPF0109 family)
MQDPDVKTEPECAYLRAMIDPLIVHPCVVVRKHDDKGILLTIDLHAEDMGRVIGKNGNTARALRLLMHQFGNTIKTSVAIRITKST